MQRKFLPPNTRIFAWTEATVKNMKDKSGRDVSSTDHPFLIPDIRPDQMGSSARNVRRPRPMPEASELATFCQLRAQRRAFVVIEPLTATSARARIMVRLL